MNSVILFHIACGIVIALTGYSITTLPVMHSDDSLESAAQRRLPTMIVGIGIFLAVRFGVSVDALMPTPDGSGGWVPAPYAPAGRRDVDAVAPTRP